MTQKEMKKLVVIQKMLEQNLTNIMGAELLGLSVRQIIRLKKKYLEKGPEGLVHGNKGRTSTFAIPEVIREQVVNLYNSKPYYGCNYHHFTELLVERENISLSRSSVRNILCASGCTSPRKRKNNKKRAYLPRERRQQRGMLLQLDASIHHWLGKDHEKFTLFTFIDDATSEVVGATFRPREDLQGYLEVLKQVTKSKGVPMSMYSDRHAIFFSVNDNPTIEDQLNGLDRSLTKFGLVLDELGIEHIKAYSPQAKGRVERLFNTLQDRLVTELRLLEISSIEEANKVLPSLIRKHNRRFAFDPIDKNTSFLQYTHNKPIDEVISFRLGGRKVANGNVIFLEGESYFIDIPQSLFGKSVQVIRTLSGKLLALDNNKTYYLKECPNKVSRSALTKTKVKTKKPAAGASATSYSPWRETIPFPSQLRKSIIQREEEYVKNVLKPGLVCERSEEGSQTKPYT